MASLCQLEVNHFSHQTHFRIVIRFKQTKSWKKFTKLYLCSIQRNYHVSYTNTNANKILLMGGETNPKTGVEIPGKSV